MRQCRVTEVGCFGCELLRLGRWGPGISPVFGADARNRFKHSNDISAIYDLELFFFFGGGGLTETFPVCYVSLPSGAPHRVL